MRSSAAIGDRRDIVLVAQSLAGFTAPLVCERLQVDLLVLLNAMIPLPGETGKDWWTNGQRRGAPRVPRVARHHRDRRQDDRVVYFHDVPDAVVEEAFARGEPQQSMTPMGQPSAVDAGPMSRPASSPAATTPLPVEFQRRVSRQRLGIEADAIDGGHMVCPEPPARARRAARAYRRS